MLNYDNNFIKPKDLALAIITKHDAMTFTLVLLE
jgi:hypothetical protein